MESLDLSQIEAVIANLSDEDKHELQESVKAELEQPFIPNPGPQTEALHSEADILLYGGAAGGGKSALEIGAFFLGHQQGLVLRREATQLDGLIQFCKEIGEPEYGTFVGGSENVFKCNSGGRLKFAGLNQPDSWRKHAGNARDYMAFDEAGEFLKEQIFSLIGWLRSTKEGQRCRVILGSNPPRGGDGEWMIEEFAPWLQEIYENPAKPGELRWAIVVGGETEWVEGPGVYTRAGEEYTAMSRTFIPARLDDNPYLKDTNYRAVVQGLPEPLRSQLLHGDFLAGREDHEYQVIPTAWVEAAQERWKIAQAKQTRSPKMLALSADIAMGGKDKTVLAPLCEDNFFDQLCEKDGVECKNGQEVAQFMMSARRDNADMSVDLTGGWGATARDYLETHLNIPCAGLVASEASGAVEKKGRLGFYNKRAEWWWRFREALDPESGEDVKLPPRPKLKAQLTAPRWELRKTKILVEGKDEIRKRLGSSTDEADAVLQAWARRVHAVVHKRNTSGQTHQTAEEEWNPYDE